ncbi:MAG: hypothetical protein IBX70_00560 [Clostridia bacterium]|nr:hypothetical protein [Clostridia bacterium]
MKSNRGSISIFMLLIVPIIAIGIFILYDHLRTYQLDNQVMKNTRNVSEMQLSNNNAHLFDYYGILAYLDQDVIQNQILALNDHVVVTNIEVDHYKMDNPNNFVESTTMASRNLIALEAVNQLRTLIHPYLQTSQSSTFLQQIKKFEKMVEKFFDFHSAVKSIEKLRTSSSVESILKSIENDIHAKLNEVVDSYEALLQSESETVQKQIQKYEVLLIESVRISGEWGDRISELRHINNEIVRLRQGLADFQTEIDLKTMELEAVSEIEDVLLEELTGLRTQKTVCAYELSIMEEKWNALIDSIIEDHCDSKPLLLNRITQLLGTIDELLFNLEPVENLVLTLEGLDLDGAMNIERSEMNMLDQIIYAEYWMGVLNSFDKGSVRNFNPLGTKTERKTVIKGEVEYLLAGKQSDPQNIQTIKMRIFSIRTVANMMHIASDASKTSQVGRTIAVLPAPWNAIAYGAMVTLWSSAEGYLDMIALYKGEGHHFIKKEEEWVLGLDDLLQGSLSTLMESNGTKKPQPQSGKLYYQDYLRLMLYAQPVEVTAERGMLLLDANIRKVSENRFNLIRFSIGHKIEVDYVVKGFDEKLNVMAMVNKY